MASACKAEPKASTLRECVRCEPTASTSQPKLLVESASKEKSPVASTSKEKSPITSSIKELLSVGRKEKLLAIAPKLPFDIDLYHWEDEHLITPTMLPVGTDGHRFWSSVSADDIEAVPVPDGAASLRTRVIEYTGSFEPVTRCCRVPLGSGKLCPRQDRYKCPFHGTIVSRDALGKCVNKEDEEKLALPVEADRIPDWQDPQLLQEIREATGVDLQMPSKKNQRVMKKAKKFPGLTDIRRKRNAVTQRLAKKVFTKSAMKRVATALDKLDHRRFRDKYGDQFHYMYDTA